MNTIKELIKFTKENPGFIPAMIILIALGIVEIIIVIWFIAGVIT